MADTVQDKLRLAIQLHQQGKLDDAEQHYRQLLQQWPEQAQAHYNLALVLNATGRPAEAEQSLRVALSIRPDYVKALDTLGAVLGEQQRYDEAITVLEQSLAHAPDAPATLLSLANILHDSRRSNGALSLVRRAIALDNGTSAAHWTLGNILGELGSHEEAISALTTARSLSPASLEIKCALVKQRQAGCAWDGLATLEQELVDAIRHEGAAAPPFLSLTLPATPQDQLTCAQRWTAAITGQYELAVTRWRPGEGTRIRLGYLSSDFYSHATSHLLVEVLELHDRSRFEVVAYTFGSDAPDPVRDRIISAVNSFVDIRSKSNEEAAALILADRIDILVDINGHTGFARPEIAAQRPAPIQVSYLGYPGTTGAAYIDYVVADRFVIPEGEEQHFSEAVARLPNCYQPNDRRRKIATDVPSRAACGLPEKGFVFCCFNASYKITATFFDVWMRLLKKAPGSVLWLIDSNAYASVNLRREAAARGVAAERLIFAPNLPLAEHLARHCHADLFLDTLPCNAHTTMSDALWAGLPAITCAGATFAGRVSASLLHNVGLGELVTTNLADYEALALALATDPARLAGIRARLADGLVRTPLFDTPQYTRDLEELYARMWANFVGGRRPQRISLG